MCIQSRLPSVTITGYRDTAAVFTFKKIAWITSSIRMPTKLGFKQPKYVMALEVTNTDKGGSWEDQGYNWFSRL